MASLGCYLSYQINNFTINGFYDVVMSDVDVFWVEVVPTILRLRDAALVVAVYLDCQRRAQPACLNASCVATDTTTYGSGC